MTKEKTIDFIVLSLRWYLIYFMIDYGWGKLTLSQFNVHDDSILEMPLKDVDSFYVAWHLFGESRFFNYVTGLAEIIGGILLIFNRTVLLGALLVLTILGQILIIDISYTTSQYGSGLPVRVSGMIMSALIILYYYKDRLIKVFRNLTEGTTTKFKYKWWIYLCLPIIGFLLDFAIGILLMPIRLGLDKIFFSH